MAKIRVTSNSAIYFKDKMLYPLQTYGIKDTFDNYLSVSKAVNQGLLELVEGFNNTNASIIGGETNTIVLLGDSNCQINSSETPGSTAWYYSDRGFFTWTNILLGQRLNILKNAGVGGQKAKLIVARISDDVLRYKPGWCFLMMGTNDLKELVTADAQFLINLYKQAIAQLTDNGIKVIISTLPPINNITVANKKQMDILNTWLRNYAAFLSNVYFVDMRKVVIDNTNDNWKTGTNSDDFHFGANGGYLGGKELAVLLDPLVPAVDVLGCDFTNGASLMSNPLLSGDVAGVATNWLWYANGSTATLSKVSRTDGKPGYWQQIEMSAVGSGALFYQNNTNVGVDWKTGETIYARCEVEVDAGYTAGNYNLTVRCLNGSNGTLMAASAISPISGNWSVIPNGVLKTIPIVIPSNTVSVRVCYEPKFIGTSRVSRIELTKAY